jgi:pilus assembly protein FimV
VAAPSVASVPRRWWRRPQSANDALAQAQSHIDRGHLNQAADVLEEAIKHEPARSDLRLKLMEVYGQQSDKDGFVTQERQLVANGENHARSRAEEPLPGHGRAGGRCQPRSPPPWTRSTSRT